MHLFLVAMLGLLLSFGGQLPLGTISFTTTQIAVQENFGRAWKYIAGATIMEMLYLRLVLSGLDWIIQHHLLFVIIGWLTFLFFFVLGILSLISATKQQKDQKAFLLENDIDRFWLGIMMSAFNPLQIPFWFLWSSYFMNLKLLGNKFAEMNLFTAGAGCGTVLGLLVYAYGGNWLITTWKTSNQTLNRIMGVIFIIAAFIQLYRMIV